MPLRVLKRHLGVLAGGQALLLLLHATRTQREVDDQGHGDKAEANAEQSADLHDERKVDEHGDLTGHGLRQLGLRLEPDDREEDTRQVGKDVIDTLVGLKQDVELQAH